MERCRGSGSATTRFCIFRRRARPTPGAQSFAVTAVESGMMSLLQEWVTGRQLMRVPGRETMSNGLLADLFFGHGRNELVVHEQSVDIERLRTSRVGGLELNGLPALGIIDPGQ